MLATRGRRRYRCLPGPVGTVGGVVVGGAFAVDLLPSDKDSGGARGGGWGRVAACSGGRYRLEFSDGTACAVRGGEAVARAERDRRPPPGDS